MLVIYLPTERSCWSEGFLIGFQNNSAGVDYKVIVSSVKPNVELVTTTLEKVQKYQRKKSSCDSWTFGLLGVWLSGNGLKENFEKVLQHKIKYFTDVISDCHVSLVAFEGERNSPVSFITTNTEFYSYEDQVIVVLYRSFAVDSLIRSDISICDGLSASQRIQLQSFAAESLLQLKTKTGLKLDIVRELLHLSNLSIQTGICSPELKSENACFNMFTLFKTIMVPLFIRASKLILVPCHCFCVLIDWLQDCTVMQHAFVQSFIHISITAQQFTFRLRQLGALYHYAYEKEHFANSKSQNHRTRYEDISTCNSSTNIADGTERYSINGRDSHQKMGNLALAILFDVFLGFLFVYWIDVNVHGEAITRNIVKYTEIVANLLGKLLNWMVGAPAGLKLNSELAHFLGKFFHYHIYLWRSYLVLIQPYIHVIVWYGILSSCFGMTFLLSLATDMLSLLTIHIYCFYVYAARLYSLEIYGLISLARLFTGLNNDL